MGKRAPAQRGLAAYLQRCELRRAIAALCLVLVCLFAGISAAHQHVALGPGTSISASNAPCELCAVAFQTALVFVLCFFLVRLIFAARPLPADPKSKSQFVGTSVLFRPPPFLF
jgi:hypothetical protein